MKRVTFAGGSLITGDTAAQALLDIAAKAMNGNSGGTVQVSALDDDGAVTVHSLLVGPGIQIEVADAAADGSASDEDARFPTPVFEDSDPVAIVNPSAENLAASENFERAVEALDASLNESA